MYFYLFYLIKYFNISFLKDSPTILHWPLSHQPWCFISHFAITLKGSPERDEKNCFCWKKILIKGISRKVQRTNKPQNFNFDRIFSNLFFHAKIAARNINLKGFSEAWQWMLIINLFKPQMFDFSFPVQ